MFFTTFLTATSISSATVGGSAATMIGGVVDNGAGQSAAWGWLEVSGSGDKEVSVTYNVSTGGSSLLVAWEMSGARHADFVDLTNAIDGGSGTNPSISRTTNHDNSAIFAYLETGGGNPDAGAGYTEFDPPAINNFNTFEYDEDVGAAGSKTINFVEGNGGGYGIWSVAIRAGGDPALTGSASTSAAGTQTPSHTIAL